MRKDSKSGFKNFIILSPDCGQDIELRRPTDEDLGGSRLQRERFGKLETNEI